MKISVILCTYNRCASLPMALKSIAASVIPSLTAWEVVVVDNNSRDRTREVVEDFCRRHPGRFRYLFEPQPGKSHALNAGIRAAKGDILAFMDDDVTVEPTWLQNLTVPFGSNEWAGVGGRILPKWNCAPPRWLSVRNRSVLSSLAVFDLGSQAAQLLEAPYGTNMAFRKEMFERYGHFRTDLGPRPSGLIRGEDTEFGIRLLAGGERLRYEPSAVVHHPVQEERLRKKYFLAWWFDKGRSDIRQYGIRERGWRVQGVPIISFRRVVAWTLRWLSATKTSHRFECKLQVARFLGEIRECWRLSLDTQDKEANLKANRESKATS